MNENISVALLKSLDVEQIAWHLARSAAKSHGQILFSSFLGGVGYSAGDLSVRLSHRHDDPRLFAKMVDVIEFLVHKRYVRRRSIGGGDMYDLTTDGFDWVDSRSIDLDGENLMKAEADTDVKAMESPPEIPGFMVVSKLGGGGMGDVYLAREASLDRLVAIKVLGRRGSLRADAMLRFRREAKVAASLQHPNICAIHAVGESKGHPYIVMQYIEGVSLADTLRDGVPGLAAFHKLTAQILAALSFAHRKGVIHRDMKPANVMVSADLAASVVDFGLAKAISGQSSDATTEVAISEVGEVLGTPAYMAPEQLLAQSVDARADVFSLGAVMYEMLAGVPAFKRHSRQATIAAVLNEAPSAPSDTREGVPSDLSALVMKCLAKPRDERYSDAGQLQVAFEAYLQG